MFEGVEAFYRPTTVREALHLLRKAKGTARIVAGGTGVVPGGDRSVRFLIDITRAGLSYIRKRGGAWTIGATTTMAEIEDSAEMRMLAGGLLASAAAACGSVEIRSMATVGGNMANGSPAADLAPPLLALDAEAAIAGTAARRKMPLADYLAAVCAGKMKNALLVEIVFLEPSAARGGWCFQKFGRTAVDISLVNVAAGLQLDARGRVKWARIALGAVAPLPLRMPAAEALMTGRILDRALLAEAAESVSDTVHPIGDIRASADYRREISRVLTGRALEQCAARAGYSL